MARSGAISVSSTCLRFKGRDWLTDTLFTMSLMLDLLFIIFLVVVFIGHVVALTGEVKPKRKEYPNWGNG